MNRTREEWKRLDLGNAPDLFTAEDYNGQTYWIMAHAKADIEELHEENARLRAQVAELVKALRPFADYFDGKIENVGGGTIVAPQFAIQHFKDAQAAIAAAEGGGK